MTEAFNNIMNTVPKEYKNLLKENILVLPIDTFFKDYYNQKEKLLKLINSSINDEINSMHKYSTKCPLSDESCENINNLIYPFVREFYKLFYQKFPKFYSGFGIYYKKGIQESLKKHIDDSVYTINMCLQNDSENNEIVFESKGKFTIVHLKENLMVIHLGNMPHFTNSISSGSRANIVLWYK